MLAQAVHRQRLGLSAGLLLGLSVRPPKGGAAGFGEGSFFRFGALPRWAVAAFFGEFAEMVAQDDGGAGVVGCRLDSRMFFIIC